MSQIVRIEETSPKLVELVLRLSPGEEITLTADEQPVARITAVPGKPVRRRQPGAAKGKLHILKEDDEHLEGFQEYMQ